MQRNGTEFSLGAIYAPLKPEDIAPGSDRTELPIVVGSLDPKAERLKLPLLGATPYIRVNDLVYYQVPTVFLQRARKFTPYLMETAQIDPEEFKKMFAKGDADIRYFEHRDVDYHNQNFGHSSRIAGEVNTGLLRSLTYFSGIKEDFPEWGDSDGKLALENTMKLFGEVFPNDRIVRGRNPGTNPISAPAIPWERFELKRRPTRGLAA